MAELKIVNMDKIYPGGFQAVYDFNIEIEHGEFVVLVGPSGCGKSTVLRMIAGLETITAGDMILDDKRINDVAPSDRDISMVFQNYALYGHMSVYQNMGFSQILRHEPKDTVHRNVMKAAGIVQLEKELNRYPKNLSGGQRQRVALGRSIVSQSNIFLMDEPLSNLDAKMRVQSRRELAGLHKDLGNTFIYVTHDQVEAMTMADRIVVMSAGRVQQIGTPTEVYHQPENVFVGGFIGTPAMNFITGRIENGRFVAPGMDLAVPSDLTFVADSHSDKEIILGIRAEHFNLQQLDSYVPQEVQITKSEYLGDHSMVQLQIGDTRCVADLKDDCSNLVGTSITIYIDITRAYFFDYETEKRIRQEVSKS